MNNSTNFIFPGRQNGIEQHGTNFSLNFSQIDGIEKQEILSLYELRVLLFLAELSSAV